MKLTNEIRMAVAREIVADLEQYGGENASRLVRLGYMPRLQTRIDRANYWIEKNGGKGHERQHAEVDRQRTGTADS